MKKVTGLALAGCGLLAGAAIHGQQRPTLGDQVVFQYAGKDAEGNWLVIPKAITTLGLAPAKEQHPAPLNPGDTMICRIGTDGQHYLVQCGMDRFGVATLGLAAVDEIKYKVKK